MENGNKNIELNFAHLCDMAFLSQEGKANIIGIFKIIFSQSFPTTHPKFSIITSLSTEGSSGKHEEIIRIVKKDGNESIVPELRFNFEVGNETKEKNSEINLIADVSAVTFHSSGEYEIKILIDGIEKKKIPFMVSKINQEIDLNDNNRV